MSVTREWRESQRQYLGIRRPVWSDFPVSPPDVIAADVDIQQGANFDQLNSSTPNPLWPDGWARLAAVIDCYDRKIIGYEFARRSRTEEEKRTIEAG